MSNLRSYQRVLLDMAEECERELMEIVRVDREERG